MPFFKTNKNIFVEPWNDELFNPNWADSDKLVLPPNKKWDYSRELQIEDVEIWEQICYQGGGLALYASWDPYAEFYLITHHNHFYKSNAIETFYGKNSSEKAYKRALELGMVVSKKYIWVEEEDLWLYENLQ